MRTRHLVTPDGTTLTHRELAPEAGGGAARRVAYVAHGQAHHALSMLDTLEGLRDRGWRVHSADLRGHGHSTGPRAPLAHMDVGEGWERLVADLRLALETAFEGTAWEDRLVVAPNIGALLALEVLKAWPDLARDVVLVTPPTDQRALTRMARGFIKARSLIHPADTPDELTMHQLYTFLGAQLNEGRRLIDVVSGDRGVTDALMADPHAWPTPTTGYFHEMFRGVESAWNWGKDERVCEGTRVLVLYGGDDPVTSNGSFVDPMRRKLHAIGVGSVVARRVEGGRAGLVLDERTLGISGLIDDWCGGADEGDGGGPGGNVDGVSTRVLSRLGLDDVKRELDPDELVELCYHAIDDESRWVEMLYRVAYAAGDESAGAGVEAQLEAVLLALMPHWDRSFKLNRQIMRSAAIGAVLQNVIDRFRIGMAVVTDDMAVSYANEAFTEALARLSGADDPGQPADGADFGAVTAMLGELADDAFRARARAGDGEALLMAEGRAVGFHFRPGALRQTALQRGGASGVLILRAGGQRGEGPDGRLDLLQFAYGLTAREAETAAGLLDGLSPEAISERLDTSIHTVRTHLRRVYEKVGVQGQNELTARLLAGPLGLLAGS